MSFIYFFVVPKTCNQYQEQGATSSGFYGIDPDGEGGDPSFEVYCDFTTGSICKFSNFVHSL